MTGPGQRPGQGLGPHPDGVAPAAPVPRPAGPAVEGLLVVDKPGGLTSHDVVARLRRLGGTRRVGHAGTLDPMATGVLICGFGRATRLLGHLAGHDKDYTAEITLGSATTTDDAEGAALTSAGAGTGAAPGLATGPEVSDADIETALAGLRGELWQIPPAYSALKVDGRRSYDLARAGQSVELAPRQVRVERFEILGRSGPVLRATVTCSTGTYVRALARDLGSALGCGGHLSALRRTRIGGFGLEGAFTLNQLTELAAGPGLPVMSLADAVATVFPRRDLDDAETRDLRFGRPLPASGRDGAIGAFGPGGELIALVRDELRPGAGAPLSRPLVVFDPA